MQCQGHAHAHALKNDHDRKFETRPVENMCCCCMHMRSRPGSLEGLGAFVAPCAHHTRTRTHIRATSRFASRTQPMMAAVLGVVLAAVVVVAVPETVFWNGTALLATRAQLWRGTASPGLAAASAALEADAASRLSSGPWTVTSKPEAPPGGTKHDYWSVGSCVSCICTILQFMLLHCTGPLNARMHARTAAQDSR